MRPINERRFVGLLIAVASTAVASVLFVVLRDVLREVAPLFPFTLAVIVSAWLGGWRAGAVATAASAATVWFVFVPPLFQAAIQEPRDVVRLVLFVIVAVGISALAETLHRARRVAEIDRASLQAKDAELDLVMNITPMYLVRCGRDLRYRFVNRATAATLGRPAEEIVGRRIDEVLGEEMFERIRPRVERVLRGETVEYEDRILYPGAGWKWIHAHYAPERDADGQVLGWVATIEDISARKIQAERLQLLSEASALLLTADEPDAMLKALFEKISQHLPVDAFINYLVDDTQDALRLASWSGITPEEARLIERLKVGEAVCGTVAERRQAMVCSSIQQSLDSRTDIVRSWGVRAYACQPLMAGERLFGTLSFASRSRDSFEEEELEFLRTITGYVSAAYERLRLIAKLREADRRKDDFLALLSHELRTPLTAGFGWAKMLSKDPNGRFLKDGLKAIESSFAAQVNLVEDLLDVSRIVSGKLQFERRGIDLARVIRSAVEEISSSARAKNIALRSRTTEGAVVLGDEARLEQVVRNLLSNAVKFTPEGGVISIDLSCHDGRVDIVVEDNGVGIDPAFLPYVFDRFTQGETALNRRHGGLGLGLSIVDSLVQAHDGNVQAESDGPGKGARFTVTLPRVEMHAVEQPSAPPTEANLRGLRILVVDDDRATREMIVVALRAAGAVVRACESAPEAYDQAWLWQPNALVADLAMPAETGYSLVRRLKETGHLMPAVAVTAYAGSQDARTALEAGFSAFIAKPFEPQTLVGAVFEATRGAKVPQSA